MLEWMEEMVLYIKVLIWKCIVFKTIHVLPLQQCLPPITKEGGQFYAVLLITVKFSKLLAVDWK